MRKSLGIMALAVCMAAGGCLRKDTTHTLYLTPGGALSWMAIERDVHSDETDAARRLVEEQSWMAAAEGGAHGVARGLAALDPLQVRTRLIRPDRPFAVVTEAEFSSVELFARRLLVGLDLDGEVTLRSAGTQATLLVKIDATRAIAGDAKSNDDVAELIEALDDYRIVMTQGRFVGAKGFRIENGGIAAVPVETPWKRIEANGGMLELSLTWER